MPLITQAIDAAGKRLPKVIDARTHGLIDCAHATFFIGMALVCRKKNPRAALAALCTGSFVLVQSLMTDYPLGAEPILSFQAHGSLDASFAALSPAIPRIFGFAGTAAATVFRANAFVEGAVVGLTDFDSGRAQTQRVLSAV